MQTSALRKRLFIVLLALAGCQPQQVQGPGFETEGNDLKIVGGSGFSGLPAVGALLTDNFLCTATLVSPTRVMTAAHCLYNQRTAGMTFLTGSNINAPQTRTRVRASVPHRRYNPVTLDNDIGYVDLVAQPRGVAPLGVVRAMNSSWIGTELLHVGFGQSNGVTETGAGTKRAVAMPILTMNSTTFRYGDSRRNTCSGDSGGPALYRTSTGAYLVAGVTSGGDEDCVSFGVDMRVDAYLDFLGLPVSTTGAVPVPPTPAPTPEPTPPPAPASPAPAGPPTADMVRAQNVFINAGRIDYYDRIDVRPGTPFRALLQGSGDADLYVRWGNRPAVNQYHCRPFTAHSSEVCELTVPAGVTQAFVAVNADLDSTYWLDVSHQY